MRERERKHATFVGDGGEIIDIEARLDAYDARNVGGVGIRMTRRRCLKDWVICKIMPPMSLCCGETMNKLQETKGSAGQLGSWA